MKALREARRGEKGFTLIEIMIVVLIIGILLAIAVPNFMKARQTSRAKSCIANLKQIEAAKEQWAMDNNAGASATVAWTDLKGTDKYIKSPNSNAMTCPGDSTKEYVIGDMATDPTCANTGQTPPHVLP